VPTGEALAQARQLAGLTVAQVSEQTCIKDAVIERIEGGDYSSCGGDFYARANIRSIAKVVGADPGPLIDEYDALHRARGVLSAVSLEELLATPVPATARRRAGSRVAREPAAPPYRPRGRWVSWIVVLGLLGALGFGVYSRFAGPRQAAATPPAAGKHAVTHQQAGSGGPGPAPKPTRVAAAPAPAPTITHAAVVPAPAAPAQTLTPVSAGPPGPGGGNFPAPLRATGSTITAGRVHQPAQDRPIPQPAPRQGPAPGQKRPSHGHDRPDHQGKRGPAMRRHGAPSLGTRSSSVRHQ
jgi:cytoskeletal protein RodZ